MCARPTAAPKVKEFLSAIFDDTPKAFQGLYFHTGSQQAIHKDSAYVKVDTNPMHLTASWLALQDIEAGTGELEYYVGSHRAPDFLFDESHKWMENQPGQINEFLESLHKDAEKYKQVLGSISWQSGRCADLACGPGSRRRCYHESQPDPEELSDPHHRSERRALLP